MSQGRDLLVDDFLDRHGFEVNRRESLGFYPSSHWHQGLELVIVHTGEAEYHCDKGCEVVSAGEVHFRNGELPHAPKVVSDRFERTVLHFKPELATYAPGRSILQRVYQYGMGFTTRPSEESIERLLWVAEQLEAMIEHPAPRMTVEALIGVAITELETSKADPQRPDVLDAVIDYMATNLATDKTVDAVAKRFGISPRMLFRWFKEYIGCTPSHYWTELRMEHARRLPPRSTAQDQP